MVTNLRIEEWHSVHQRLRQIAKRRGELDAEEARYLRDAERIQLWRKLGYVHMGEYLEREMGYGPHAGAERMRVARELAELPQIEAALGEGALHYSAVRELSRIATQATEAEWLEAARGKNLRQLEPLVSGRKRGDRPRDPAAPELVSRVVRLELSPEVFALFRQAQGALADEHGGRLDDNAFVQALCRRALEGDGAAAHARPAHQISLTVCESCKRGWQNGAGREIEVGAEVIERAQCDAELLGSLDASQPARVTATVTPRIRRQVMARDHHCCTVPGCRSARGLDIHHIEYQCDGGSHEIWNLTALCTGHHNQLHAGALSIRGRAPDGLEFTWRAPAPVGNFIAGEPCEALASEALAAHNAGRAIEPISSHGGRAVTSRVAAASPADARNEAPPIGIDSKPAIAAVPDRGAQAARGDDLLVRQVREAPPIRTDSEPAVAAVPDRGTHAARGGDSDLLVRQVREASRIGMDSEPAGAAVPDRGTHAARGDDSDLLVRHVREAPPIGIDSEPAGAAVPDRGAQAARGGDSDLVVRHAPEASPTGMDLEPAAAAVPDREAQAARGGDSDLLLRHASEASPVGMDSKPAGAAAADLGAQAARGDIDLLVRQVREALTIAGYKPHEARRAVEQARSHVGRGVTLEQLLREALRCCTVFVDTTGDLPRRHRQSR